MKKTSLAILFLLAVFPLSAQTDSVDYNGAYDSGESKIKNNWAFDIQISTDGFVLGGSRNIKIAPGTFFGTSLDMFWVRGKNEAIGIDYYTGLPTTINSETILLLPLEFHLKRRILTESISNTLRPYLSAGLGAVYGLYISGDKPAGGLPVPQDKSQFAPTASLEFGADFGKPGTTGYGVEMRYQFIKFKEHLGARESFNNFQIGFHVNL